MKTCCFILLLLGFSALRAQEVEKIDSTTLKTVTITTRKSPFTYKNGNLQVNVGNSILSTIPDAMDLLSKVPTVQVARDGESVSIVGKGEPLIYIDHQKVSVNDLRSLSVADIKTIELINDPSAKYEANGRAVILITRKISAADGMKAELAETAAYRKYYLNRSSANISVRRKRLELKGDIQFNELRTWEGNDFDFNIKNRNIFSGYRVTAVTTRQPQLIGGGGFFYQWNEQDYLSGRTSFRTVEEKFPIYTQSTLKDQARDEFVSTSNYNKQPVLYHTSNINYNNSFRKIKSNLFLGAQYTKLSKATYSTIYNAYQDAPEQLSQDRNKDAATGVLALRADLDKKFSDQMTWETGLSASFARAHGFAIINNYSPNNSVDAIYSYHEHDLAAYTQLSGKFKKISYTAGIRMESSDVNSVYQSNITFSAIDKANVQLFPRAKITVPVDSATTVSLAYTKSIVRPGYDNADQTSVYINPYFEWSKNINLDPSLIEEIKTTFQYKKYAMDVVLYQTRGPVYTSFSFDDRSSVLTRTETNFDIEKGIYVNFTVPFKYKIWSSANVLTAMLKTARDSAAITNASRPFAYYYSANEFLLPHHFVLNVTGWAVTSSDQGVLHNNGLFSVDTSLSKKINKLTWTLRFNNMFKSINSKESFTVNDVAASGIFYDNSRNVSLGVKYAFGGLKESKYNNHEIDESSNRIR
jgi:hypothetical protein